MAIRVYFQFPLCCLSFDDDLKKRVNSIVSYTCVEMGQRLWARYSPELRDEQRGVTHPLWCKNCPQSDAEVQALLGCMALHVTTPNFGTMIVGHAVLSNFVAKFEQRHGPDARVRIVPHWIWEAISGRETKYIEMATLAAIYSKIGATKGPVRITRDEIWRRALGFKSRCVFTFETRDRKIWIRPRQVRSAIERLHDRRCFARITYARRESYYSHRMTVSELSERIVARKVQRAVTRQDHRRTNDELTNRVETERRRVAALTQPTVPPIPPLK